MSDNVDAINVEIGGNTERLQEALEGAIENLGKFGVAGELATELMAGPAGLFAAAMVVVGALNELSEAFAENERADLLLNAALDISSDQTLEMSKSANEAVEKMMRLAGASDESAKAMVTTLVSTGRTSEELDKMTTAALGLSNATGMSLDAAMTSLNTTFSGQIRGLARMTPELKLLTKEQLVAGEAIDVIIKKYGELDVALKDSADVSMKRFAVAWDELMAALGKGVAKGVAPARDALTEIFDFYTKNLNLIDKLVIEDKNLRLIEEYDKQKNQNLSAYNALQLQRAQAEEENMVRKIASGKLSEADLKTARERLATAQETIDKFTVTTKDTVEYYEALKQLFDYNMERYRDETLSEEARRLAFENAYNMTQRMNAAAKEYFAATQTQRDAENQAYVDQQRKDKEAADALAKKTKAEEDAAEKKRQLEEAEKERVKELEALRTSYAAEIRENDLSQLDAMSRIDEEEKIAISNARALKATEADLSAIRATFEIKRTKEAKAQTEARKKIEDAFNAAAYEAEQKRNEEFEALNKKFDEEEAAKEKAVSDERIKRQIAEDEALIRLQSETDAKKLQKAIETDDKLMQMQEELAAAEAKLNEDSGNGFTNKQEAKIKTFQDTYSTILSYADKFFSTMGEYIDADAERQIRAIDEEIAANKRLYEEEVAAAKTVYDTTLSQIDAEEEAALAAAGYLTERQKLEKAVADAADENARKEAQLALDIYDIRAAADVKRAEALKAKEAAEEAARVKEAEATRTLENKKAKIKYDADVAQYNINKAMAIASGALAIVQGYAQLGPVAGTVAALVTGGVTIAQLAIMDANPPVLQQFASGTDFASGGLALVGEQGPEIVNVPRGSQVLNASETRNAIASGKGGANITNNFFSPKELTPAEVDRQLTQTMRRLAFEGTF